MKLLLENWKRYLVEYTRGYSSPEKVRVVSQILYYSAEGGRLFVVAEFEEFVGGPMMKFGFYTTRGESVAGTEESAFSWVPTYGIGDDGWVMKIPNKYADKDSLLGMVSSQLNKLIPPTTQQELRMKNKGELIKFINNQVKQGKDKEQVKEDNIKAEISQINGMFKRFGVYKKAPKQISQSELADYEEEFRPKSSTGSSIA